MVEERSCNSCGARLPGGASARRLYCDDVCRAHSYRSRKAANAAEDLLATVAEAELRGDSSLIRQLTCPECQKPNFAGVQRRRDAIYCSGSCRTRAWWRRRAARA